ncbi:MAG: hypothetical protein Q7T55_01565 [Solirubrobacteraceae bacterium]|nr:hypothetical protein [Solirubrobacteraceae bacterium]
MANNITDGVVNAYSAAQLPLIKKALGAMTMLELANLIRDLESIDYPVNDNTRLSLDGTLGGLGRPLVHLTHWREAIPCGSEEAL